MLAAPESSQSLPPNDIDSIMLQSLKNFYLQQSKLPRIFEEDEDYPEQDIKDSYINLAIVKFDEYKDKEKELAQKQNQKRTDFEEESLLGTYEDIHTSKEPIKVEELFNIATKNQELANKRLIYGRAGSGKTTLMKYISYQWARPLENENNNFKDFKEKFKYVFNLPLRELTKKWYKKHPTWDRDLAHFIHYCCFKDEDIKLAEIKEIIKNKEALLLFDGYDEVTNVPGSNQTLTEEILEQALAYENIIMTSRPNAVPINVQKKFGAILENIGLVDKNIKEYINKYYEHDKELGRTLENFLLNNKAVWGIYHIPINLQLICYVWKDKTHREELESNRITFTYLYRQVMDMLMRRYISKDPKIDREVKEEIVNMKEQDIEDQCNKEYKLLEKIAYLGMKKGEIIIEEEIFEQVKVKPKDYTIFRKIGILKALGDGKTVRDKEHYFIHLTFQEFMAARYLIRMLNSDKEQKVKKAVKFVEENKYNRVYERVMWFAAGLASENKDDQALLHFWNVVINGKADLGVINQSILLIRCLEEAGVDDRIPELKKLLHYIKELVKKSYYFRPVQESLIASQQLIKKISIVEYLISKLKAKNQEIRRAAEKILEEIRDKEILKEVTQTLISELNDSNEEVVSAIAFTLAELKLEDKELKEVTLALIPLFYNEKWHIRQAAISALGWFKSMDYELLRKVAQVLIAKLDDENFKVQEYVLSSLIRMLKLEDKELLRRVTQVLITLINGANKEIGTMVVRYLADSLFYDEEVIDEICRSLIIKLHDKDSHMRYCAALALGCLKLKNKEIINEAVHALIAKLNDEDHEVLFMALFALCTLEIKDKETLKEVSKAFIAKLNDENEELQEYAIKALEDEKFKDREILEEVINALIVKTSDKNEKIQKTAIEVLVYWLSLKDKEVSDKVSKLLINMLKHEDRAVRDITIYTLSNLNLKDKEVSDEVIKLLINKLNDEDSRVCFAAINTLSKLKLEDKEVLNEVIKLLINKLNDEDSRVRYDAINKLGNLHLKDKEVLNEVIKLLINKLNDEDSRVRFAAINKLGNLHLKDKEISDEVIKLLINKLNDEDRAVRDITIYTLSNLNLKDKEVLNEVIKLLINKLNDEDSRVRYDAINTLGKLKLEDKEVLNEVFKLLINKLNDEDRDVHRITESTVIKMIVHFPDYIIENAICGYLPGMVRKYMEVATTLDSKKIVLHRDKHLIAYLPKNGKLIETTESIFTSYYHYHKKQGMPTDMLDNMLRCMKMVSISGLRVNVDDIILSNAILEGYSKSMLKSNISLDCINWAISIVRKDRSICSNEEHAFLILEGRNIFCNAALYKLELTQPNARYNPRKSNIVIGSCEDIKYQDLERVFQTVILGNDRYSTQCPQEKFEAGKHYYSKSCSISYEACMRLLKEVKGEEINLPVYNIRGDSGVSIPEGEHNCFTWAREKLQKYLSRKNYEAIGLLESWKDIIVSQTSEYLNKNKEEKRIGGKREYITLM